MKCARALPTSIGGSLLWSAPDGAMITTAPPVRVPVFSGFDYITVDEARGRVYAAHTASQRLLVVDARTGDVAGQVWVGPMHGVVVDPQTGDVFTGDGTDQTISKVDPQAMKVLASVDVPGAIDDMAYDAGLQRIYADEDKGSHVYVIDAKTMKLVATLTMPSTYLESPDVDPATHVFYQNFADVDAFAIVDPTTLKITRVVETPQLQKNHPLVVSESQKLIAVGGVNGVMSTYTLTGERIGDTAVQKRIDQCDTGSVGKLMVCAGNGVVNVIALTAGEAPKVLGSIDTGHPIHTVGIDEKTGDIWVVWSDKDGDFVQRLLWNP